jgi:Helix-turn-helix domain
MTNPCPTPRPPRRWRRGRARAQTDGGPSGQASPRPRRRRWTVEEIRDLGATTDLVTAAAILGVGRSTAYTLARAGQFPAPVIRAGARYLVPVPALLALLHATPTTDPATGRATGPGRT